MRLALENIFFNCLCIYVLVWVCVYVSYINVMMYEKQKAKNVKSSLEMTKAQK